ncbi:hypothetical protein BH23PLA1_BH23PLA1_13720 [soil metagenome]
MREFDKPIGKVWRRLRVQRFLVALVWTTGAALLAVALAFGLEKLSALALPVADWVPFAIAGGVGLVLAALIGLFSGPSRIDAAVAIDRAFHLNERLATALTLPADLRDTPAGRALFHDARRHIDDLDIGSKFGLRIPRTAWVPIVPGLLAVGLLFLPEFTSTSAQAEAALNAEAAEEVARQAEVLNRRIGETREKLDKDAFAESEKLLAEIEKAAENLAKAPPGEKEKALVELNKLTDALKDRQKQVGDSEQISRKLQQLRQMTSEGPADNFSRELAKGDFDKAAEQLRQLREKLASGDLSEAEKKQLQQQLSQMKEQLEKLANLEERKKQLEEARKAGAISEEQYEQQMAKLNDQAQDMKKLQQLAQQLGQCENALAQGDMQKAAQALGMSEQQLQQMASEMAELETLDAALADLQMAKDGMTGGDGMNQMGRRLDSMNQMGMGMNNGQGMGRGRGQGDRPEAYDETASYNTKVQQQYGPGKAILEGFGPPGAPNVGDSIIEAQDTIESSPGVAAEALTNQKVPGHVKKHVINYFEDFREN